MCVSVGVCIWIGNGSGGVSSHGCGSRSSHRSSWGCGHGLVAGNLPSSGGRRAPARMETRVEMRFVQEKPSASQGIWLAELQQVVDVKLFQPGAADAEFPGFGVGDRPADFGGQN